MSVASGPPIGPGEQGWVWHLFRVSGLVLFILLPIHVGSTLLTTDVAEWSATRIATRWADPTWRALDWALVVLGLAHGGMGLARLAGSGLRRPAARAAATALIAVTFGLLGLAASVVVFTFEVA